MARRKAFLHIGLPRSGGGFLTRALAENSTQLAEAGYAVAAQTRAELFPVAVEIRRDHKAFGLRRKDVEGSWAEMTRRLHKTRRNILLSEPMLAAATRDQAALFLDGLAGYQVHLVITVRDLGSQVVAEWEEHTRSGGTVSFESFSERIEDPERSHQQAERFWAGQDLGEVLERWSNLIRRERIHLIVAPGEGDVRPGIWRAFGDIAGFDAQRYPLPSAEDADLDPTAMAVLREVNRALDDQFDPVTQRNVINEYFARDVLGPTSEAGAGLPAVHDSLREWLRTHTERWVEQISRHRYHVTGSLDDVHPRPAKAAKTGVADAEVAPDEVLASTAEALARVLADVASLRERNDELEARVDKLDRKRRKLKRKLRAARETAEPAEEPVA